MREPSQVFTLLETMYHSFDNLALKYNIFKVETVGDCVSPYVCYILFAAIDPHISHFLIIQ